MVNKKGEISSEQLVLIIIAIVGFVIVLIFWASIKYSYTEDEICKFSVLSRATTPVDAAKGIVPLKCTTKKICISDGKGKCSDSFAGESNVEIVTVDSSKPDAAAETISKISAEQLYSCWDLMGQGKLNIFPDSVLKSFGFASDDKKAACVICSRVAVDNNIGKGVLDKVDISLYLKNNQVPGKAQTYLQAMTDKSVNSYPGVSQSNFNADLSSSTSGAINLDSNSSEKAFIFSQRTTETDPWKAVGNLWKTTGVVAGSAFVYAPTRSLIMNAGKSVVGVIGAKAAIISAVVVGVAASGASYYGAYQTQQASAGYCGALTSGADKNDFKNGCSITSSVPYTYKNIDQLCGYIDGNL